MRSIRGFILRKLPSSIPSHTQAHKLSHTDTLAMFGNILEVVWAAELVHKTLGTLSLLHDSLLVVLTDGTGKLVIVHGWPVLAFAPESCHTYAVLNLEYSLLSVQPADA